MIEATTNDAYPDVTISVWIIQLPTNSFHANHVSHGYIYIQSNLQSFSPNIQRTHAQKKTFHAVLFIVIQSSFQQPQVCA